MNSANPASPGAERAREGLLRSPEGVIPGAIEVAGRAVAFSRAGDGPLGVILVHGALCERTFWNGQLAALARQGTVVTMDLAGHGASAGPMPPDISDFAADVVAVAAAVGLQRTIVVGHSFGALVALEAARQLEDRAVGIVVIDMLHNGRFVAPPRRPAEAGDPREFMRQGMFAPTSDAGIRERILDQMLSGGPAMAQQLQATALAHDAPAALQALAGLPLSMIFGGRRPVDPEAIRALRPDARLFALPHAGHFLMIDEPDAFNALLATELRIIAGAISLP